MPDVRDLADAITVAFDDLCALPRPGEPAHEDSPTLQSVVRQAGREVVGSVGSTVGRLARSMVKTAVDSTVRGAVAQVTRPRKPVTRAASRDSGPATARKRG